MLGTLHTGINRGKRRPNKLQHLLVQSTMAPRIGASEELLLTNCGSQIFVVQKLAIRKTGDGRKNIWVPATQNGPLIKFFSHLLFLFN